MDLQDHFDGTQPQMKKTKKRRNRKGNKGIYNESDSEVSDLSAGLGLLGQPRLLECAQMRELFHIAYESLSLQDREKARTIYKLAKTDAPRVMDAFQAIFGLACENGRGAAVFTDPGRDEGPLLKAMYQLWVEKCEQVEPWRSQNGSTEDDEAALPAPFSLDSESMVPDADFSSCHKTLQETFNALTSSNLVCPSPSIHDLAAAAASLSPSLGLGPPSCGSAGSNLRLRNNTSFTRPPDKGSNGLLNEAEQQVAEICMHLPILKQAVMQNYGEGTANLVSQIEVLLKSREPTASQARELFKLLLTSQFCSKDIPALEALAFTNSEVASAPAIVALAFIYDGADDRQAVRHYLQAAQFDDSIACMQLGAKYLRGEGVRADNALAYRWYLRAAELNNPIAQHKVGYFNDEGLEGVCGEDLAAAVHWYTEASELIPDSLHNLAKIYEDGRGTSSTGNEDPETAETGDILRAVHLYSVAAARGFSLSQVNLGRLFLLGEKGVSRDREAGRRLLVLAAESGDCDAQMVVGMIHATPAFDAYDLPAAELWLRRSLRGGKSDAQRLLARVQQQMASKGLESLPENALPGNESSSPGQSSDGSVPLTTGATFNGDTQQLSADKMYEAAAAAAVRGDDFRRHNLHEAAVLEYTRAWETDPSRPHYLFWRVQSLFELELWEESLPDCTALVTISTRSGSDIYSPQGCQDPEMDVLGRDAVKCLGRGLVNAYWCSDIRYNILQNLTKKNRHRVVKYILGMLLDQSDETAKAAAFLARLTAGGPKLCKTVMDEGGIPILVNTLEQSTDEQVLTHCAGAIINFTQQTHQISALVACDVIPILAHQARNGNPRPAFSAIQALGNIAVLASEETWQVLIDSDLPAVFDSLIRATFEQIQQLKELMDQSSTPSSSIERFQQTQADVNDINLQSFPKKDDAFLTDASSCLGMSSTPDQVQVALTDLLSASSLTLARVLQRCPDEFVSALVSLDLMGPLREVFQARVLPQQLRSGTAFALCRLLLAKERHARDLLKQSVERFANCRDARDILARGGGVFQEISENAKDNPEVMDSVLKQLETMGRMLSRNFADEKEAVDSTFLLTTYNFHVGTSPN